MWISGPPGVGKSAILQTVCEELAGDNESHPVDGDDDDENDRDDDDDDDGDDGEIGDG